jgi:hypothetical protein
MGRGAYYVGTTPGRFIGKHLLADRPASHLGPLANKPKPAVKKGSLDKSAFNALVQAQQSLGMEEDLTHLARRKYTDARQMIRSMAGQARGAGTAVSEAYKGWPLSLTSHNPTGKSVIPFINAPGKMLGKYLGARGGAEPIVEALQTGSPSKIIPTLAKYKPSAAASKTTFTEGYTPPKSLPKRS